AMREAVVLSTCNRAEVYAACDEVSHTPADVVAFMSDFHGIDRAAVAPHIYHFADSQVTRHLFPVAPGLYSLGVGGPPILGQVKEAHAVASEAQAVGPVLNRLFHASFGVGKRVRTETALGSGAVSIGYAAVALAKKIFGGMQGRHVLVIGAGDIGKLTALHMKSQGASHVTIISRTMAHAARTAEGIGGSAAPWDEMDAALAASDIVITATGAQAPILTKARIETVMRRHRNRPLFIVDIALPRDVEAAAGEIEQVFVYNIDDLQATVRENLARRESEVTRAETIVGEELDRFGAWFKSRGVIPTVVALRQRFEPVRKSELDRLEYKRAALPPEARAKVDEITPLMFEKLLLAPTEQLKALGDSEAAATYTEALARLFGLADAQAAKDAEPARREAS